MDEQTRIFNYRNECPSANNIAAAMYYYVACEKKRKENCYGLANSVYAVFSATAYSCSGGGLNRNNSSRDYKKKSFHFDFTRNVFLELLRLNCIARFTALRAIVDTNASIGEGVQSFLSDVYTYVMDC